ncbi:hypothetical protein EDD16DRAFT_982358 [Pisolithus croceorrhizus]|nr:hypothetical protein EDD16DRAFT_982358 [Pisolithus croceorrhizus]
MPGRSQCDRSFLLCRAGPEPLIIKQSDDILSEASTQHFFHLLANSDKSASRVPKVFDAFSSHKGYCLMVMEKIAGPTLSDCGVSEEEAVEHAASAVKWILSSEVAPVSQLCRKSAQPSASVLKELLTLFQEESSHLPLRHQERGLPARLERKVCIIDFQYVGVLPQAFQTYSLSATPLPPASAENLERWRSRLQAGCGECRKQKPRHTLFTRTWTKFYVTLRASGPLT